MSLEQKLLGILIEPSHEKFTPYMYLDRYGHLIYGLGRDLGLITEQSTLDEMKKLTLYKGGHILDLVKIEQAYRTLKALFNERKIFDVINKTYKIHFKKHYFRDHFGLFVSIDNAYGQLKKDISIAISDSRQLFSMFDTLPSRVQVAIALLTYRMGLGDCKRFIERETNFKRFIEQNKWRDAGILIDKIKAWQDRKKRYVCNLLN